MTGIDIVIALVRCLNLAGLATFAGAVFLRILVVPGVKSEGKTTAFFENVVPILWLFRGGQRFRTGPVGTTSVLTAIWCE